MGVSRVPATLSVDDRTAASPSVLVDWRSGLAGGSYIQGVDGHGWRVILVMSPVGVPQPTHADVKLGFCLQGTEACMRLYALNQSIDRSKWQAIAVYVDAQQDYCERCTVLLGWLDLLLHRRMYI